MRATIGTDDIFKRDFSAPTGEDKFDRSMLPKVMQVRNVGQSGIPVSLVDNLTLSKWRLTGPTVSGHKYRAATAAG
jgi:hypothetical protein